jgi:hypothetical protein
MPDRAQASVRHGSWLDKNAGVLKDKPVEPWDIACTPEGIDL